MTEEQNPKYKIEDGKIVDRKTGEPIPDDEPIFILRGKDRHTEPMLRLYAYHIRGEINRKAILNLARKFGNWSSENIHRMSEPGFENIREDEMDDIVRTYQGLIEAARRYKEIEDPLSREDSNGKQD